MSISGLLLIARVSQSFSVRRELHDAVYNGHKPCGTTRPLRLPILRQTGVFWREAHGDHPTGMLAGRNRC